MNLALAEAGKNTRNAVADHKLGGGKKYKKCCLPKHQAKAQKILRLIRAEGIGLETRGDDQKGLA